MHSQPAIQQPPPGSGRRFISRRMVGWLLLGISTFGSTGCPQLNYWDGPSKDPFFRVADPVPAESPVADHLVPQPRLVTPRSDSSRLR